MADDADGLIQITGGGRVSPANGFIIHKALFHTSAEPFIPVFRNRQQDDKRKARLKMKRIDGKRVLLITGGGSGLGELVVRRLLDAGLCICTTVRSDSNKLRHDDLHYLRADMNNHEDLPAVVERAVAICGRLDALVCNAAVQGFGHVHDITPEDWQETLNVNLTAPFILGQAAAPHLKKTNGLITFISSVHGVLAAPSRTMYAVSKAGLIAMARNMAADLSPDGIRVISLILGPFGSPALAEGVSRFFPGDTAEDALNKFARLQPLGRIGSAGDLADLIGFLMSDAAGFITGTSITIDGGLSSRLAVPEIRGREIRGREVGGREIDP